ncbi:hypothetical protein V8B97DRAFT_1994428 [Scleroderma yunnanense]
MVSAYPLGPLISLNDDAAMDVASPIISPSVTIERPVEANAYIWGRPLSALRPELWTFEEFVRHKASEYIRAMANVGYGEVDKHIAADGRVTVH